MKAKEILEALSAKPLALNCEENMEKEYGKAFASDLMSDVLAMVHEPETTVLITGLCNAQSIRTAEMMDITLIIFVRGKKPVDQSLDFAEDYGINIFSTDYTMYETCGILFGKGLEGLRGGDPA